jgi:alpha,alpha-trehalase
VVVPEIARTGWPGALHSARKPLSPIADYGFVSDCEVTALIASSGSVEWMCLPRMDGPSIFAAILDRDAGSFRVPRRIRRCRRARYLPGTMVLETTPLRKPQAGAHR